MRGSGLIFRLCHHAGILPGRIAAIPQWARASLREPRPPLWGPAGEGVARSFSRRGPRPRIQGVYFPTTMYISVDAGDKQRTARHSAYTTMRWAHAATPVTPMRRYACYEVAAHLCRAPMLCDRRLSRLE